MADIENFQNWLQMVVDLRSKASDALKATSEGASARHGSEAEGKDKKYLSELKLMLDNINSQIKYLRIRLENMSVRELRLMIKNLHISENLKLKLALPLPL